MMTQVLVSLVSPSVTGARVPVSGSVRFVPTRRLTAGVDVILPVPVTAGDHVTWRRIGLYTAADWKAMRARGVTWFDGDSYVRGVV